MPPFACTLAADVYATRIAWIASLNRTSLRSHRRVGAHSPSSTPQRRPCRCTNSYGVSRRAARFSDLKCSSTSDGIEMRRNSAIHLSQRRGQFPERSCTQGSCEDSLTAVRSRARAVSSSLPRVPPSGSKNTCVDAAFRRGMIRTARFGPDFQGVFYGALWTRIAVARTPVVSFR